MSQFLQKSVLEIQECPYDCLLSSNFFPPHFFDFRVGRFVTIIKSPLQKFWLNFINSGHFCDTVTILQKGNMMIIARKMCIKQKQYGIHSLLNNHILYVLISCLKKKNLCRLVTEGFRHQVSLCFDCNQHMMSVNQFVPQEGVYCRNINPRCFACLHLIEEELKKIVGSWKIYTKNLAL